MEGKNPVDIEEEGQYRKFRATSPKIVEIGEESNVKGQGGSIDVRASRRSSSSSDVYVAIVKNDLHVVKWALDHVAAPGVGLSRSQLSKEELQFYIKEENNKIKHMLGKYIQLCNESKVAVDTMLVESNASTKAILELIVVANVT